MGLAGCAQVAAALQAFAQGKHCLHRGTEFPNMALGEDACFTGRYTADGTFSLTDPTGNVITDEAKVIQLVNGDVDAVEPSVIAIADHYQWWADHGSTPSSGKPLWITASDRSTHHIFFDDNIHNDADDSIVAARHRATAAHPFAPLSGAETLQLQHTHTVRVPTVEPILDHDWFLKQIATCEDNFKESL